MTSPPRSVSRRSTPRAARASGEASTWLAAEGRRVTVTTGGSCSSSRMVMPPPAARSARTRSRIERCRTSASS
ncbi:MAG: hypothetical protein ACYTFH_06005 [Planctomycetota bacterium]